MKTFKDIEGADWMLSVNVSANKRVRAIAGVDLLTVLDNDLLGRLRNEPELLVNVIYALCQPEAVKRQITDEAFGALLVGDAIDRATAALTEDLVDFFPQARRQMVRKAATKVTEIETAAIGRVTAKLDGIDVAELVRNALGGSSTNSPASAASTQTPAPSAN